MKTMLQLQIEKLRAFLVGVCTLALVQTAIAGPASPQSVQAIQPNGNTFQTFMRGDEFQGWMETADGFTVLKSPATGNFEYAQQDANGQLVPSGIAVAPDARPMHGVKGLRPAHNDALARYQGQFLDAALAGRLPSGARTPVPVTGAKRVLTILVSFQDATVSAGATAHWGNAVFSATGVSVNRYFQDNSFGAVSIAPVAHTQTGSPAGVVSVSLAQTHPNCGSNCSYQTETSWVNSALAAAAPYVNFSALDTNADGNIGVDEALIYFVLAGYEASANATLAPNVWSHAWGGGGVGVAGKSVSHWALSGEMYDTFNRMGIGVVAHELGHAAGLPDLYDTSFTNAGLGGFSLMGSGSWGRRAGEAAGTTPVALDALSRQFLGWSTPQTPVDGATVTLVSGLASTSAAVLLMNSSVSGSEYWLAENRPPIGWDVGLQEFLGSWNGGLLIQHVNLNAGAATLRGFNRYVQGRHQGALAVEPITASCTMVNPHTSSRGCATLLFHAANSPAFSGWTVPSSNYYNGLASGLGLSNISAPGNTMTGTVGKLRANAASAEPISTSTIGGQRTAFAVNKGANGSTQPPGTGKVTATGVSGGSNVALASAGGVATASSVLGNYYVTYINDNERAGFANGLVTSWVDGNQNVFPDWVQINFNGSKTIDQVILYTFQDAYTNPSEPTDSMTFTLYGATSFTVQTWDGSAWVTQSTVTGNNLVKRSVTFPAVTTDRIRVYVNSSPNGYSYITELEAWTTGVPTPPSAPTIGTATAGDTSASVAFTPGALGSGTLVNYTADCGGITATGASSPITVTGLTNGVGYTCKVKTTSSVGTSAWSASSNSVTPAVAIGGINVALAANGGVASASSVLGSYFVTYANDGERPGYANGTITSWVDNTPNVFPDWVQINFNGAKTIDRVVLYTLQNNLNSPVEPTDSMTFSLYGATGYSVQTWNGTAWVTQATVTGNNLVKRSITFAAVTTDRIRVYVNSSPNGYSYITELEAFTAGPAVPPSAPTIGTATAGDTSASVAFTPGALGSGTLVNYTADCGGITATGMTSPITVTGLTNGTSYLCKVKTTTSAGTSPWSANSNAVTPAAVPPSAPSIGTATAGNASASVAFTPGALGSGTLVNHTADCGGITATGSSSPIDVTGLTNGTVYNCKVRTTTSRGTSPWSALSNAVTPINNGTPPSAPSIGTAIALDASASVNFTPGSQGTGTLISYTADCGGITTSTTSAPITVTGLTNSVTYNCKVRTTTSAGTSAWSALSNAVIPMAPKGTGTAPSAPFIDSASAGNASASVAFIPGELGTGSFVNYTADCNGITANGTSSPINVIGLTNGVSYTCKVRTVSTWQTGPWSAPSNAVTPAVSVTLPVAPTKSSVAAGTGSISVAFIPGNLGSGTLISYTAACGAFTATGVSSPINVTGLTNGTSYICKVRTTTTAGVSAWSANSNAVVPDVAEPAVTYFHNDISGSPMLATDGAGAVIWKENYRPYGERLNNQAGSSKNKLGFAGKQFDPATGLSYMGARYYDPVLGRFMGVDPIGVREDNIHSLNRYAYANNNPYKFTDPDGRDPISSWRIAENVAADSMRNAGWVVEQGVEIVMKGRPGELDIRGVADFLATKNGELVIGEVKDGKGAKLSAFQKAMFGEAGALERLAISSADRAQRLGLVGGELLVTQLSTSAKVAYTLTGELGGRAAGEASRRAGGGLATRVAFGALKVVGSVPVMLLTQPRN